MNINELKFYLKRYKILTVVLYLQLSLFFVIMGTFFAFVEELDYESKHLQELYEGKAIYQLLDGYYNGDLYSKFVSQPDYLSRLKKYYNELNTAKDFHYLAMFDHHIFLEDNGIPQEFSKGYEQGSKKQQQYFNHTLFSAVKAFQMNKQALDFFGLIIAEGSNWTEDDFEDASSVMPVLLGSSYRNVYSIGEEMTINYYGKTLTIKVIGFLKENSKVFFKNNTEFYLDKYILLPYRNYEDDPLSEADELFQQISYFAMINGYVVTENKPSKTKNMMQRIDAIAQKTGFEYSFIGMNPHFNKYRGLMTVLQENKRLVQSIFISTIILNLIIINIILLLQQKRRLSFYAIHYINGATKKSLVIMQWTEISCVLLAAYLTNFIVLDQILKIGDFKTQFILFILCLIMSIIACIFPSYKLLFNPIVDYLYHEEEEGGS